MALQSERETDRQSGRAGVKGQYTLTRTDEVRYRRCGWTGLGHQLQPYKRVSVKCQGELMTYTRHK